MHLKLTSNIARILSYFKFGQFVLKPKKKKEVGEEKIQKYVRTTWNIEKDRKSIWKADSEAR